MNTLRNVSALIAKVSTFFRTFAAIKCRKIHTIGLTRYKSTINDHYHKTWCLRGSQRQSLGKMDGAGTAVACRTPPPPWTA